MRNSIEFACFVNNTGFSHAAIDYAKSLRGLDIDVSIRCIHNSPLLDSYNEEDKKWILESIDRSKVKSSVQFRHLIPPRWKPLVKCDKNVALAVFESTNPPREWISAYKNADQVICPSEYCADVFWSAGLPIRPSVVPHAIDSDFWVPRIKARENGIFRILSVGTWRSRKNWKNIIRGAELASMQSIPIELVIKTDKGEEARKFYEENVLNKGLKISIVSSDLDYFQMRELIYSCDCLLSASVGEGFCMPPMQAMACGVPVICAAIGGCLEYVYDENCIRIEPRGYARMAVMDNIPQFKNQEWAVILAEDVSDAICKMISVDSDKRQNMISTARAFVENNFSYRVVGNKMSEMIFGTQA
jgi:glycosyltransferase involved in cell wall biosynthesis